MHLIGEIPVEASAKAICARTASDQVIMLENALMWQFVIIVAFQGTLHQNAPRDHYVGTVKNQAIQLAIVQTRASATPVVRLDTLLETAQLPQFPPGT